MKFIICAWLACGLFVHWAIFRYARERSEMNLWQVAALAYSSKTQFRMMRWLLDCAVSSIGVLLLWPGMVAACFRIESVDDYHERVGRRTWPASRT